MYRSECGQLHTAWIIEKIAIAVPTCSAVVVDWPLKLPASLFSAVSEYKWLSQSQAENRSDDWRKGGRQQVK